MKRKAKPSQEATTSSRVYGSLELKIHCYTFLIEDRSLRSLLFFWVWNSSIHQGALNFMYLNEYMYVHHQKCQILSDIPCGLCTAWEEKSQTSQIKRKWGLSHNYCHTLQSNVFSVQNLYTDVDIIFLINKPPELNLPNIFELDYGVLKEFARQEKGKISRIQISWLRAHMVCLMNSINCAVKSIAKSAASHNDIKSATRFPPPPNWAN